MGIRRARRSSGRPRWQSKAVRPPTSALCTIAVPGLCKAVTRAEIAAADWSLTPGRYVGVAPADARLVVREMQALNDSETLTSLAWVIMPDHVHWLFQLGNDRTLSHAMKGFKASSALSSNRFLNRCDPVWQRGFYDHAVDRRFGRDVAGAQHRATDTGWVARGWAARP